MRTGKGSFCSRKEQSLPGVTSRRRKRMKTFSRGQSSVAGPPTNGVQFTVKNSKKYASTGGWGFAHFNDGKPADEAFLQSCFPSASYQISRPCLHPLLP